MLVSKHKKFCIIIRRFVETIANLLFSCFNNKRLYSKNFFIQKPIEKYPKKLKNQYNNKGGKELKTFTYSNYIKCIHKLRLNAVLQLAEESQEYQLENNNDKCSEDKLIKNILKDKKEAEKFINYFIQPKNLIKAEELTIYTNNYITKKYKSKKADLIYKIKNQEIFFLIEYQSIINNNIEYRLLNYCIDIMQEWSRNKKIGINVIHPIIVPIVIYTGNKKWKIQKDYNSKQISSYVIEKNKINIQYNLVDINKFSKQELVEQKTRFSQAMLIKKLQNEKEIA